VKLKEGYRNLKTVIEIQRKKLKNNPIIGPLQEIWTKTPHHTLQSAIFYTIHKSSKVATKS